MPVPYCNTPLHPAVRRVSRATLRTLGVFPAVWDELDAHTCSFPKAGRQPGVWRVLKHHFDTMGTREIAQWKKMGSQDKLSSSVSSLPASQEKMGHRSGQIHALARRALTWGCLRLPWLERPPLLSSGQLWCTWLPARNTGQVDTTCSRSSPCFCRWGIGTSRGRGERTETRVRSLGIQRDLPSLTRNPWQEPGEGRALQRPPSSSRSPGTCNSSSPLSDTSDPCGNVLASG